MSTTEITKPRAGDKLRFVVDGYADETVELFDTGIDGRLGFHSPAQHVAVVLSDDGRPAFGRLEPLDLAQVPASEPRPKQHDEISLDEWRHKIRTMRWP